MYIVLHCMCVQCLWSLGVGGTPGAGVIGGCELPNTLCWEHNLDSLQVPFFCKPSL